MSGIGVLPEIEKLHVGGGALALSSWIANKGCHPARGPAACTLVTGASLPVGARIDPHASGASESILDRRLAGLANRDNVGGSFSGQGLGGARCVSDGRVPNGPAHRVFCEDCHFTSESATRAPQRADVRLGGWRSSLLRPNHGGTAQGVGLVPDSVQRTWSERVPVSPGKHLIRVRIASDDGSVQENAISGEFVRNGERGAARARVFPPLPFGRSVSANGAGVVMAPYFGDHVLRIVGLEAQGCGGRK
jgi:hypothetical protein